MRVGVKSLAPTPPLLQPNRLALIAFNIEVVAFWSNVAPIVWLLATGNSSLATCPVSINIVFATPCTSEVLVWVEMLEP